MRVMALLVHFIVWPIEPDHTKIFSTEVFLHWTPVKDGLLCFLCSIDCSLYPQFPPHPVSTLPPSRKFETPSFKVQQSILPPDHRARIHLCLLFTVYFYFGLFLLVYGYMLSWFDFLMPAGRLVATNNNCAKKVYCEPQDLKKKSDVLLYNGCSGFFFFLNDGFSSE